MNNLGRPTHRSTRDDSVVFYRSTKGNSITIEHTEGEYEPFRRSDFDRGIDQSTIIEIVEPPAPKMVPKVCKHIGDNFNVGDLIRFKSSGEVMKYHSSEYSCNYIWTVYVDIRGTKIHAGSYNIGGLEKVNSDGVVIDDFKQ